VNKKLSKIAAERGGWFTWADALAAGYSVSQIRLRVRRKQWLRLCRDMYIGAEIMEVADEPPWERTQRIHLMMTEAVLHRMDGDAVLSHQSATLLHGLPIWGLDYEQVHVTRSTGRARSERSVQVHRSALGPEDVCEVRGLRLTTVARAFAETTCTSSYEVGVSLADAALRAGLVTKDELIETTNRLRFRPGSPAARAAAEFADGRSESVGETRLRVLMANQGLPRPELQVEIRDAEGRLLGRVDFLVEQALVVELDGAGKYASKKDLVAEKWREDRIREQGYAFIRVGWPDLDQPVTTGRRLHQALAQLQKSQPLNR
jgi:hypothetical protein